MSGGRRAIEIRVGRGSYCGQLMKFKNRQQAIGVAVGVLFLLPLILLQTQVRKSGGRGNLTVWESASSFGWPFFCRHSNCSYTSVTGAQISQVTHWSLFALAANIFVILFTGLSFGVFFAGITTQARFSIAELCGIIFLAAIVMSLFSSNVLWPSVSTDRPRQISQSPVWANYLVYFSIGAAVASVLRISSKRSSTRNRIKHKSHTE